MIVKMKKVTIATLTSMVPQTLEALADLGVLHVVPTQPPESRDIDELKLTMDIIERASNVLSSGRAQGQQKQVTSALDTANQVLSTVELRDLSNDRLQAVLKETDRLKPLGDFSPSDMEHLKENGITAKIYRCSKGELRQTEIPVSYNVVGAERGIKYVLAVGKQPFDLPFEEFRMPEKGRSDLEKEAEIINKKIADLENRLTHYGSYRSALERELSLLTEQLEFSEISAGMGREGTVSFLRGYCPTDDLEKLRKGVEKMSGGLMLEDPSEESDVPTLIKNPPWVRIIEPVFNFLGILPGYGEFDVSLWFFLSLSLFFAILVGDGGYALLFCLGTFLVRRKFKSVRKEPFVLLYIFSGTTILWGLVTGTWFGVERLAKLPVVSRFVLPDLNSFSDNQDFMMRFCFLLGFIHMTIAHMIRGFRLIHSIRVLSQIGWILILSFLYFLTNHLVLGSSLPGFSIYLLLFGFLLSGLFSNPRKNYIRSSIVGLADLPLNIITSFSDLVSYLRLFAVGYATVIVAASFNEMAASLGAGSFLRSALAGVLLLIGHAINISLAAMAVLVHGVRLNMLEFSTHLGMTWSGKIYKPFKRRFEDRAPLQT